MKIIRLWALHKNYWFNKDFEREIKSHGGSIVKFRSKGILEGRSDAAQQAGKMMHLTFKACAGLHCIDVHTYN